jgi:hypothetical protein
MIRRERARSSLLSGSSRSEAQMQPRRMLSSWPPSPADRGPSKAYTCMTGPSKREWSAKNRERPISRYAKGVSEMETPRLPKQIRGRRVSPLSGLRHKRLGATRTACRSGPMYRSRGSIPVRPTVRRPPYTSTELGSLLHRGEEAAALTAGWGADVQAPFDGLPRRTW